MSEEVRNATCINNNFLSVALINSGANAVQVTDSNGLTLGNSDGVSSVGGDLTIISSAVTANQALLFDYAFNIGGNLSVTSNGGAITQNNALRNL